MTCTDIAITDDTIVEWNEDFHVAFEIPPGTIAKSGVFNVTRIVIVDDDGMCNLSVARSLYYNILNNVTQRQ